MRSIRWQFSSQIRHWLPRLQAHRGYWVGGLKQNTLAAIQKAAELKYQMVEFDVRLTADKIVILFHDEKMNGVPVSKLFFEDVLKLDAVSTLEEVCYWLSKHPDKDFKINIELKTNSIWDATLEKKVAQIIHHFKIQEQILISSFNPLALGRIRFLCKNVFRALLLTLEEHPKNKWYFRKMLFNFFAKPHVLHLRVQDWSDDLFHRISKLVPVVLWTYNENFENAETGSLAKSDRFSESIHGIISDDITPAEF